MISGTPIGLISRNRQVHGHHRLWGLPWWSTVMDMQLLALHAPPDEVHPVLRALTRRVALGRVRHDSVVAGDERPSPLVRPILVDEERGPLRHPILLRVSQGAARRRAPTLGNSTKARRA